jgi:hypothetical protein
MKALSIELRDALINGTIPRNFIFHLRAGTIKQITPITCPICENCQLDFDFSEVPFIPKESCYCKSKKHHFVLISHEIRYFISHEEIDLHFMEFPIKDFSDSDGLEQTPHP